MAHYEHTLLCHFAARYGTRKGFLLTFYDNGFFFFLAHITRWNKDLEKNILRNKLFYEKLKEEKLLYKTFFSVVNK